MSYRRPSDDRAGPSVAVIDSEVPNDTWQSIGRDSVQMAGRDDRGPRRWGASASTTALWSVLPAELPVRPTDLSERSAALAEALPPRRVPREDIVLIGRATPHDPAGAVPKPGRRTWRELFFLTILGLSLLGAWQSGRLNGVQKVIVVPAPESRRSMIT